MYVRQEYKIKIVVVVPENDISTSQDNEDVIVVALSARGLVNQEDT